MDSLTHLVAGAAIAAAIAPARHRRAALLAGAALHSLPDLDVLPLLLLSDDPVVRMTWHRAATHSLLVLPFIAWALWAGFRLRGGRVAQAPRRWLWVFMATLLAHPLLDAFTVYGTQLLWPLPLPPVMWSSVFIIDPALTLPLLLACAVAWFLRERIAAQRALACGLVLAGTYLGWSLLAKALVEREADVALAPLGLQRAPRFSVPTPFNALRWRVVAMTADGFVEGEHALLGDGTPIQFQRHRSDAVALEATRRFPAVARLLWFNHHFVKAEVIGDRLVLSDLRMGAEPDYTFRFEVAARDRDGWRAIPPEDPQWRQTRRVLGLLWRRIWRPSNLPANQATNEAIRPGQRQR